MLFPSILLVCLDLSWILLPFTGIKLPFRRCVTFPLGSIFKDYLEFKEREIKLLSDARMEEMKLATKFNSDARMEEMKLATKLKIEEIEVETNAKMKLATRTNLPKWVKIVGVLLISSGICWTIPLAIGGYGSSVASIASGITTIASSISTLIIDYPGKILSFLNDYKIYAMGVAAAIAIRIFKKTAINIYLFILKLIKK